MTEVNDLDTLIYYICIPLGLLMRVCRAICGSYGLAIVLFTLATKIVLLPLSVWIHKNSILMVKIQPEINFIKAKFYGDGDSIAEEQSKLFKREKYHPMLSLVPLVIQIVLLMGVVYIIDNPTEYLRGFSASERGLLGLDLGTVPSEVWGMYTLVPLVAGASAYLLCVTQNASNVLQHEQGKLSKYGLTALSVGISLYLGCFVQSGVALYWVASNVFAIVQMYILNAVINPKRYVDYDALERSRKALQALDSLDKGEDKAKMRANRARERRDCKRFFGIVNKHIVFYSEKSGFYKYYEALIDAIEKRADVVIHYITNDPDDAIFETAKQKTYIKPYYIGLKKTIPLMMRLEADIVVMTTPDFNKMFIKRSVMKKDIEYIYVPHDMMSVHMGFREGALDEFDTVFCTGEHVKREIRATEAHYGLPQKTLVEFGYPLADGLADLAASAQHASSGMREILIAPSWQEDNLLDSCIDTLIDALDVDDWHVTVRPHPEYVKRYGARMSAITEKYASRVGKNLTFELDFSSNTSIYTSDLLITDWSGIAPEFCFATGRPALFINTQIKCLNPNWQAIGCEPVEMSLRNKLGECLEKSELDKVRSTVKHLLECREVYAERISKTFEAHLYNHGKAADAGAKYIISQLLAKKNNSK